MGWLTGWFRRRADDSAAVDREARPRDFESPLSGEGPPRVPDGDGTGAGPTNSAPAATPQAGAAAAAVGGAVLLGAELLHSLASDPAAASADKAEAVADTPPDGEAHEAAPEPSSTARAADATAPAEPHRDAGVDASDRGDGDGGGDAGDGGGGDGGD